MSAVESVGATLLTREKRLPQGRRAADDVLEHRRLVDLFAERDVFLVELSRASGCSRTPSWRSESWTAPRARGSRVVPHRVRCDVDVLTEPSDITRRCSSPMPTPSGGFSPLAGPTRHPPDACAGELFPGSVLLGLVDPGGETSPLDQTISSGKNALRSCRCDSRAAPGPGTPRFAVTTALLLPVLDVGGGSYRLRSARRRRAAASHLPGTTVRSVGAPHPRFGLSRLALVLRPLKSWLCNCSRSSG